MTASFADDTLIEETDITVRTYAALKRNNLNTVGEVRALSRNQVESLKNIHRKSIEEIEAVYGVTFQ